MLARGVSASLLIVIGTYLLTTASCRPADRDGGDTTASRDTTGGATRDTSAGGVIGRVTSVSGFRTPEAVRYDPDGDVWYVSNINGNPNAKDNNGFISRLRADGTVDSLMLIAGGRGRTTLNAPKGLWIAGDTLWVTDIDVIRAFSKRTGEHLISYQVRPAPKFLNDITGAPDGAIYITDTGIAFDAQGQMSHPGPDRIYKLQGGRTTSIAQGARLAAPNGITWDRANERLILVSFDGKEVLGVRPDDELIPVLATGPGGFDGVELLSDGRVLISSWADSSIYVMRDSTMTKLISGVPSPADIGIDTRRNRLAIPVFTQDRVEIWRF
jgi:sugar lactone lactonase YvrE